MASPLKAGVWFLYFIDGLSVCPSLRGRVCASRREGASRRRPSARSRTTFYMRDIRFT